MKNRLKFRVYSILDKKYLENLHFIDNDGDICFKSFNGVVRYENQENFIVEYDTGLKDKNGKEIFEGDIIIKTIKSEYLNKEDWSVYIGKIEIKDGCYICDNIKTIENNNGYKPNEILFSFENEIIGNIYEDSNLLDNKEIGEK